MLSNLVTCTWLHSKTPEGLCRSENVTIASIYTVVSTKWAKIQFWVNYPFKVLGVCFCFFTHPWLAFWLWVFPCKPCTYLRYVQREVNISASFTLAFLPNGNTMLDTRLRGLQRHTPSLARCRRQGYLSSRGTNPSKVGPFLFTAALALSANQITLCLKLCCPSWEYTV